MRRFKCRMDVSDVDHCWLHFSAIVHPRLLHLAFTWISHICSISEWFTVVNEPYPDPGPISGRQGDKTNTRYPMISLGLSQDHLSVRLRSQKICKMSVGVSPTCFPEWPMPKDSHIQFITSERRFIVAHKQSEVRDVRVVIPSLFQ